MLGKTFLARLSKNIAAGKVGSEREKADCSFGGVNIILCGDLHQFPPVARAAAESLYRRNDVVNDPLERQIGRAIYEEFKSVVILKKQMRVTDPEWRDFLTHLRYGQVKSHHMEMLKQLVLGNEDSKTDFSRPPWSQSLLVTPRHAVRRRWNQAAVRKWCRERGERLFICTAEDTIGGKELSLLERYGVAMRTKTEKRRRRKDLDITNGARGTIVDIRYVSW